MDVEESPDVCRDPPFPDTNGSADAQKAEAGTPPPVLKDTSSLRITPPSSKPSSFSGGMKHGALTPQTTRGGTSFSPNEADPSGTKGSADALKYVPGQVRSECTD
jgi:hypothetical protein